MNRFLEVVNRLIVNYVYGVKTKLVPEVKLPLDRKTIAFAREHKDKIKEVLDFQAEDFHGSKLPISLDTLNQRTNRVFEAIQNINSNFLELATPENIDNPTFNTSIITEQMARTFGSIDLSILSSEEVLQYRENGEILALLRDNNLRIDAETSKGISIINSGASIDEFKKFVSLNGMTEILATIPDEKFIEGEYKKFVDLYGKHIPEMKPIGSFLDILIKLNLEKDEKYASGLRFINTILEKTGLSLIKRPYNVSDRNKISHYLNCDTHFKITHFLSIDDSIKRINPLTKKEINEQEEKDALYRSISSLISLSENYKSKLSPEFREKLEVFFGLDGQIKISDVLALMDSGFNISAREIQIEMLKVKDALRETYTSSLTSLKDSSLSRAINEYGIEEIILKGEPFNFLHHSVRTELFEKSNASSHTRSSSEGEQEIIHETWSEDPIKTLNPNNFDIDDQCYNTLSTCLVTSNNIEAHNFTQLGMVHLIYTDIPKENIIASNREGRGKERLNPIYFAGIGLQPFHDLKNQEETKASINPWFGGGEIVVARNKIVKNEDETEIVNNNAQFLKPSAIIIYGDKTRKPTEREIRIALSFGIPFIRIDPKDYPLSIQEELPKELTYNMDSSYHYEKVTEYLKKHEETRRQAINSPKISKDIDDEER